MKLLFSAAPGFFASDDINCQRPRFHVQPRAERNVLRNLGMARGKLCENSLGYIGSQRMIAGHPVRDRMHMIDVSIDQRSESVFRAGYCKFSNESFVRIRRHCPIFGREFENRTKKWFRSSANCLGIWAETRPIGPQLLRAWLEQSFQEPRRPWRRRSLVALPRFSRQRSARETASLTFLLVAGSLALAAGLWAEWCALVREILKISGNSC